MHFLTTVPSGSPSKRLSVASTGGKKPIVAVTRYADRPVVQRRYKE